MGEVVLVGLGLHDEKGISLKGLEEVKSAENVFAELYTSLLPGFSVKRFEEISGKKVRVVSRRELEDENGQVIFKAVEKGKVVLLVPGDPFIATTHIALRLEAEKRGIKTRIIHGASIMSAAIGLTGLHNYKFGRSVTIPFPENFSKTPYEVIVQNRELGLHTLCFLDIDTEEKRYLSIREALEMLLKVEAIQKRGVVTNETLALGIARAGSPNPAVKADDVRAMLDFNFGSPPYILIFPGRLHFMEAKALVAFAKAPLKVMEIV